VVNDDVMTAEVSRELCAHFGECGGCLSQDIPYEEQLQRKATALEELFCALWKDPIPITQSPLRWRYRNRLDFNFGRKHYPEPPPKDFVRESALGFRRRGRWYWPVDVQDCRIGSEQNSALLDAARTWMKEAGLQAYDQRSHQGTLRALLFREGKRTGQRMVVLITREPLRAPERFLEALRTACPVDSVYQGVFAGLSDIVAADDLLLMEGAATIDEELHIPDVKTPRRLRFRLSPFSFFQTNTLATETLYGSVRAWVRKIAPTTLYDLYGGSGGIAFSCSDLVNTVTSVESVESATSDGVHNAEINGIGNVQFHTLNVEEYLRREREAGTLTPDSAVILDPPRAGLHPKALKELKEWKPRNILYISCKPSVLAEELKTLTEVYEVADIWAVDLFPHTPHVEAVAWLRRRGE